MSTNGGSYHTAKAMVFDGAGKLWVLSYDNSPKTSELQRFDVSDVLSDFPSNGTAEVTYTPSYFFDSLVYQGGYLWAGSADSEWRNVGAWAGDITLSGALVFRIDPATGTVVGHVTNDAGGGTGAWNVFYAHGSLWVPDGYDRVRRWDLADFEPRDNAQPTVEGSGGNPFSFGGALGHGASDGSRVWVPGFGNVLHVITTGVGTETDAALPLSHDNTNDISACCFDGTGMWMASTLTGGTELGRCIIRWNITPGSEAKEKRIGTESEDIRSIVPGRGAAAGGTSLTLKGEFTGATGVTIDGVAATSFVLVNDGEITCVTPARPAGYKDVVVQRSGGDLTLIAGFRYT
jgi:hypothetical protein